MLTVEIRAVLRAVRVHHGDDESATSVQVGGKTEWMEDRGGGVNHVAHQYQYPESVPLRWGGFSYPHPRHHNYISGLSECIMGDGKR